MESNMNQNEADIEAWYSKRRWTTALAMAQTSLLFFEYSAFQISGLYYFEKDFPALGNPKLFYSMCMGIIFLSGLISVIVCARYIEGTGDLRMVVTVTLALNALGNFMYTWTYSPYFALFGRFIAGANMGIQRAVSGKLMWTR